MSWLWTLFCTLAVLLGGTFIYSNGAIPSRSAIRQALLQGLGKARSEKGPHCNSALTVRTFRVRGLHITLGVDQAQSVLREILDRHGCFDSTVQIKSLERATSGIEKVATVDFDKVPAILQGEQMQRNFQYKLTDRDLGEECTLTVDSHFHGFTPSYADDDHHSQSDGLDIIAVSGLGGHPFGSFKARGDSYMWLRDAIGKRVPNSRVWIYGYSSRIPNSNSMQTISDLALGFLSSLTKITRPPARRQTLGSDHRTDRPAMLIGHSLGGLIIKQALIYLSKSPSAEASILDSLYGLLFFGVPNRGIANESLLAMSERGPNEYLLHTLGPISEVLQTQHEEFTKCSQLKDLKMYCFYETATSPTAIQNEKDEWVMQGPHRLLVTKDSATCFCDGDFSHTYLTSINSNHSDLVKFQRHDDTADSVFDILKHASENAKEVMEKRKRKHQKLSDEHEDCLKSLAFENMDHREREIVPASPDSGGWLQQLSLHRAWKESRASLLCIRGHPGTGKSTLMKRLSSQSHQDGKVITLSYFFYGQGSPMQRCQAGMTRSLLHQLMRQCPQYSDKILALFEIREQTYGPHGETWTWTEIELHALFNEMLLMSGENFQVEILIDAPDEAGERVAVDIFATLQRIVKDAQSRELCIRAMFSCRYFPSLPIPAELQVHIQDHNQPDVESYIHDSLGQRQGRTSATSMNELTSLMMERANGNFQWTKIVLGEILEKRASSGSMRTLRKIVFEIPKDLTTLYSRLLHRVDEDDREDCIRILQWVAFSARPITLAEIQVALILGSDLELDTLQKVYCHEDFIEDILDLRERVRTLSKGLITVDGAERCSVLSFIHQSVQDYVVSEGLSDLQNIAKDTVAFTAHYQLYRSCIHYLYLEDIYEVCEAHCSAKGISQPHSAGDREFAFLDYAIPYWTRHVKISMQTKPIGKVLCLKNLKRVSQRAFDAWTSFHYGSSLRHFPSDRTDLLHIMAGIGIVAIVSEQELYDQAKLRAYDSNKRQPLSWASEHGHCEDVRMLLDADEATANCRDILGRTPLWWAASEGHAEVAKILLGVSKDLEARDVYGDTTLSLAVNDNHVEVVKLLLDTSQVDVNSRNDLYRTPLWMAAAHNNVEIVKLLLGDSRVDPNAGDVSGITPLWIAASRGHAKVVRLLLEDKQVDVNRCDILRQTPLWIAASEDRIEVVMLLLEVLTTSISSFDIDGRTPLWEAASKGHVELVKLLLGKSQDEVNHCNRFDQSPLSIAASEGHISIVKILLTSNHTNVNSYDKQGRTPTWSAAYNGHAEVIRCMFETSKKRLNLCNAFGQSLLVAAALHGHTGVAKFLLEELAMEVNQVDKEGRSALSHAAERGHLSFTSLLLSCEDIIVDKLDNYGWTAAFYASYAGHDTVVRVLEEKGANLDRVHEIAPWNGLERLIGLDSSAY